MVAHFNIFKYLKRFICKIVSFSVHWIILSTILPNFILNLNYFNSNNHNSNNSNININIKNDYFSENTSFYNLNSIEIINNKFNKPITNSDVILVIAHPDDESMFFGPSILELNKENYLNNFHIICLSNGNYDNLGEIRYNELIKSSSILGLNLNNIKIYDEKNGGFKDNINENWDLLNLEKLILNSIKNDLNLNKSIINFLTFDKFGVSNHPNHKSIYYGLNNLIKNLQNLNRNANITENSNDIDYSILNNKQINLWTLKSLPIYLKYSSNFITNFELFFKYIKIILSDNLINKFHNFKELILNNLINKFKLIDYSNLNLFDPASSSSSSSSSNNSIKIFSDVNSWFANMASMTFAHYSQIVWFRWFWLLFSKYLNSNELILDSSVDL